MLPFRGLKALIFQSFPAPEQRGPVSYHSHPTKRGNTFYIEGGILIRKNSSDDRDRYEDIELPQSVIDSFARFLVPEIRKYYDSEQGQREFAEWQEAHNDNSNHA